MKLKWLRTGCHVGYTEHRPLRKITIEHWCMHKRCSNHSMTIIQQKKNRDKEQIPKGRRKLEIILVWYSLLYTKTENYKEQYTNKKGDKELKLKCLRTVLHGGNAWHRPLRKITIKRWCSIKCCSNHSIKRIQKWKRETRTNTKENKRLEIILVIYI